MAEERKRRVNVVLDGDVAATWDVTLTKLGINESGRNRASGDEKLVVLALLALEREMVAAGRELRTRYPSYEAMCKRFGLSVRSEDAPEQAGPAWPAQPSSASAG
ncbi:hypothetical protein [Ramlibacter alkalitolerans]|uniref:CopG family transcriptional regulator n=1 Tax=Ramlibacter alkalitolerans TaxID=2039631 RepID=A0ABS1JTN5_9BURK|nr:hypothetical protein [Ramlibacter alkalitolerans]MBL0427669.1 hypothetical protein [Ramlibacter alkalitolerans]